MSPGRVVRFQVFGPASRERLARGYRWAHGRPSWVARATALTFLVVVGLPILLLVALAGLAAALVFGVLALAEAGLRALRGGAGGEGGRENVRVIRRR